MLHGATGEQRNNTLSSTDWDGRRVFTATGAVTVGVLPGPPCVPTGHERSRKSGEGSSATQDHGGIARPHGVR